VTPSEASPESAQQPETTRRANVKSRACEGGYLLRLDRGERLPDALADFCGAESIPAATAEGLGALENVTLGFFDVQKKVYERTTLPGSWELLSLFADVATWEGELFAHTHVVLSGPDFVARGGHLFEGRVSVTAELRVWTLDQPIERRMDPEIRLHLWDL
jgi:predicted DNA-binding protein with PD1-like motif